MGFKLDRERQLSIGRDGGIYCTRGRLRLDNSQAGGGKIESGLMNSGIAGIMDDDFPDDGQA